MEWACRAYLVPETTDDNDGGFRNALEELEDAFWTESLSGCACKTSEAIKSALIKIVSATDPTSDIEIAGLEGLPERPRRRRRSVPTGQVARRAMATGTVKDAIGAVG